MKTHVLFPRMRRGARDAVLCAGLGCLSVAWPRTAGAQPNESKPYTFTTLAGKAAAGRAQWLDPRGLAVDAAGNVYVANFRKQTICRMTPAGDVTILAGRSGCIGSADGKGDDARFCYPQGVALDVTGDVYVADSGNNTIRRVTPAGVVTTLAGLARQAGSTDGTGRAARFSYPRGVAVDSAGNILVADLHNFTIRKVTRAGTVTTLAGQAGICGHADGKGGAAQFDVPFSVAVDAADNVYVADLFNNAIRKVTATGVVTTLVGQLTFPAGSADATGKGAGFYHPCGLAVDSAGNVLVADTGNQTIRRVTPEGAVVTQAGMAGRTGNADGIGDSARFNHPYSLALDPAGNLYVVDLGNTAIRKGVPFPTGGDSLLTTANR